MRVARTLTLVVSEGVLELLGDALSDAESDTEAEADATGEALDELEAVAHAMEEALAAPLAVAPLYVAEDVPEPRSEAEPVKASEAVAALEVEGSPLTLTREELEAVAEAHREGVPDADAPLEALDERD